MICPGCRGAGRQLAYQISRGVQMVACVRCHGARSVPRAMSDWMIDGDAMRSWRITVAMRGAAEEAARRGVSVAQLCEWEDGRSCPVPSFEYLAFRQSGAGTGRGL